MSTGLPPERNNPGYRPEHKELEAARQQASNYMRAVLAGSNDLLDGLGWLAAEVRVMRLERALER